jgi:hypothetical protein
MILSNFQAPGKKNNHAEGCFIGERRIAVKAARGVK